MPDIRIPTGSEVEKVMIDKDKELDSKTNPLDALATFFFLYMPRFKSQTSLMSKKELIKLINTLVGSEYVKKEEVNKLLTLVGGLNTSSVLRVLKNSIEFPLNEKEVKSMSSKEKKVFNLLENIFADKYVSEIENIKDVKDIDTMANVIKHSFDEKEFNKRKDVEKDSFSTGNRLLLVKTLLIQYTILTEVKIEEDKKKEGELNG